MPRGKSIFVLTESDSQLSGQLDLMSSAVVRTPLVIKPFRSHRGKGMRLVRNLDGLTSVPPTKSPVLIQEYVKRFGEDLKEHVTGNQVTGVRKKSPTLGIYPQEEQPSQPGRSCEVGEEVKDIALTCGEVLGLGLYGPDILETPDRPQVVDLNAFPSYCEAPNPAFLLASNIDRCASRIVGHDPMVLAAAD